MLRADETDLLGFDGAADPDASTEDASACREATVADDDEDKVDEEGVDATEATGGIEATVRAGSAGADEGAGRNEEDDDDGVGKSIVGDKISTGAVAADGEGSADADADAEAGEGDGDNEAAAAGADAAAAAAAAASFLEKKDEPPPPMLPPARSRLATLAPPAAVTVGLKDGAALAGAAPRAERAGEEAADAAAVFPDATLGDEADATEAAAEADLDVDDADGGGA